MASPFSYIGDIDDPSFYWDNPEDALIKHGRHSNLPCRIVPKAPYESLGVSMFILMDKTRNGGSDCKQLDWGAWGWKLTGQELAEFFGPDHEYAAEIATLVLKRHYVLVTAETA